MQEQDPDQTVSSNSGSHSTTKRILAEPVEKSTPCWAKTAENSSIPSSQPKISNTKSQTSSTNPSNRHSDTSLSSPVPSPPTDTKLSLAGPLSNTFTAIILLLLVLGKRGSKG